MKTTVVLLLSLAATIFVAPANAAGTAAPSDSASETLDRNGRIVVTQAGPFVAIGTFRVQVAAKLGRPDLTLPDGTWMFRQRRVNGSNATGTLVVQFTSGRVSSLSLVTPAVALAMYENAKKSGRELVATK